MDYPITITRDQIVSLDACEEGIAAFDLVAPSGTLTIPDVAAHVAILSTPLAEFDGWAIGAGVVAPIMATAGDYGTATAGVVGTATAGCDGTATAGDRGTATAGDHGTATAGDRGTATAGDHGTIRIEYWDTRRRTLVGYVGEDGIKADTPYRVKVDDRGVARFVAAE